MKLSKSYPSLGVVKKYPKGYRFNWSTTNSIGVAYPIVGEEYFEVLISENREDEIEISEKYASLPKMFQSQVVMDFLNEMGPTP